MKYLQLKFGGLYYVSEGACPGLEGGYVVGGYAQCQHILLNN